MNITVAGIPTELSVKRVPTREALLWLPRLRTCIYICAEPKAKAISSLPMSLSTEELEECTALLLKYLLMKEASSKSEPELVTAEVLDSLSIEDLVEVIHFTVAAIFGKYAAALKKNIESLNR